MSKKVTRAQKIINFIKKAPKSGRTYTDMLKFAITDKFGDEYCRDCDRGLIAHCMTKIREVTKKVDDRYIFAG